jgi:zinc-binding alcohol dehydrogenase/oxidoreductase
MPQAVVVREFGGPESLVVEHRGELVPGPGEVVIDLRAAALNRRDLRVIAGGWPAVTVPLVPGSDGAGVVRALGGGVSGIAEGDEVVVLPALDWGDDPRVLGPSFRILGGPDDGTFAEQVRVPAVNVFPKPSRLPFAHAAALPLAGLTVWRALFTRGGLTSGQSVLVLGAGAGTSTFAVQIARAAGARVFVTSSSPGKISRSLELGAEAGFDYTKEGWEQAVVERSGGGVDLVLDSAGTWQSSVACVRAGGRVVVFGGTAGTTAQLDVRGYYFKQLDIVGTMMGSPVDFRALLRACELQTWTPIVDSERPLTEVADAFRRQAASEQFGKLVLTV